MWTKNQIKFHTEAAKKLSLVKEEFKNFLSKKGTSISENEAVKFVKNAYKKHGLVNDNEKEFCIVAFGKNTKEVHYFPKGKGLKLKNNTLILLDIWARLPQAGAPYADTTFMFYFLGKQKNSKNSGKKIPKEIQKTWKVLVSARDTALNFLEKIQSGKMPRGLDIDRVAHDIIGSAGLGKGIKHTVGHSLGLKHPHGDLPGINWREYSSILKNVGYTIEPGIYLKDFGMRTEIDFYITNKNEIVITTPPQKTLYLL